MSGTIGSLNVLLKGAATDLEDTYAQATNSTRNFATNTELTLGDLQRFQQSVNRQNAQMMREGAQIYKEVMTAEERYAVITERLTELLNYGAISQETFNRALAKGKAALIEEGEAEAESAELRKSAADSINALGVGLGLAFGAEELGSAIRDRAKEISEMQEAAEGLNISFRGLQEVQNATFVEAGVDAESFIDLLEKMNKDIGQAQQNPKSGVAKAISDMNLSIQQLKGLGADQQFRTIVDALSRLTDENQRAADATAIFGRSYAQLMPLIEGGTGAMDAQIQKANQLGEILSDTDAKAFQEDAAAIRQASEEANRFEAALVKVANVAAVLGSATNALNALFPAQNNSAEDAVDEGDRINRRLSMLNSIISANQTLLEFDNKHNGSLAEELQYQQNIVNAMQTRLDLEQRNLDKAKTNLASDRPGSAEAGNDQQDIDILAAAIGRYKAALDAAQKSLDSMTKGQKEAAKEEKAGSEAAKEFESELNRLLQKTESPFEKYSKDVELLTQALLEGKISLQQFNDAMAQAAAQDFSKQIDKQQEELNKQAEKTAGLIRGEEDEAKRIHEEVQTQQEKIDEQIKRAQFLHDRGFLDDQDFQRRMKELQDQLNNIGGQQNNTQQAVWRQFDFRVPSGGMQAHDHGQREANEHLKGIHRSQDETNKAVNKIAAAMPELYRFGRDQHENMTETASL